MQGFILKLETLQKIIDLAKIYNLPKHVTLADAIKFLKDKKEI